MISSDAAAAMGFVCWFDSPDASIFLLSVFNLLSGVYSVAGK